MNQQRYIDVPVQPDPAAIPPVGSMTPKVVATETVEETKQVLTSLMASAMRLTQGKSRSGGKHRKTAGEEWQEDAWEMYDLVPELGFLANVLAGQAAKARFYVGTTPENPADAPVPSEDKALTDALLAIGDGPQGLARLVFRLAINLYVPGDGFLVGIPEALLPGYEGEAYARPDTVNLDELDWRMLSVSEMQYLDEHEVELSLGDGKDDKIKVDPEDVYLIRVWREHPRRSWDADSPTRRSLTVLRELVGLTMHISAQIDSRLAGAGVIIAPASAAAAAKRAAGLPEDSAEDPFTDALIEAMSTPISDRSNASAYTPLVWVVPDEAADLFQFMSFDKGLDGAAKEMREEAIRRFALGSDAPPELLLGVGGMNHWGAWIVQEDVVRTHLEPTLALLADALTEQYLRPVMEQLGYSQEVIDRTVVWYDVSHLITRPNQRADALALHGAGVISDAALRAEFGYDDVDAPPQAEDMDPAVAMAFEMVKGAPSLAQDPGLVALVAQIKEVLGEAPEGSAPVSEPGDNPVDGPPAEPAAEPEEVAASALPTRREARARVLVP